MKKVRCAIYTRKSSEEGLDQEFNSLDAQREACEAYIASQKHEGWVILPEHYDDGGVSGGTLERSGLQRLLKAIDDELVDQIIVYKIDRLTRSLMDFSRLIERLDAADASFVSVTQSFNTATSMGRLTLNVLLSFAQFEREVTAERIRDKIAASKKKGMWMGGPVPLGYRTENRQLIIQESEAAEVRTIYDLYQEHRTVRGLKQAADINKLVSRRWMTKSGKRMGGMPYSRGHLYRILTNPIYIGQVCHKRKTYEGQHKPIIDVDQWQQVQDLLKSGSAKPRNDRVAASFQSRLKSQSNSSSLLGKLFDETGDRLTPSHANKKGRRYRYYVSNRLISKTEERQSTGGWRLPAQQLEQAICDAIRDWIKRPSEIQKDVYPDSPDVGHLQQIIEGTGNLRARLLNEPNPIHFISTAIEKVIVGNGKLIIYLQRDEILRLLELPTSKSSTANSETKRLSIEDVSINIITITTDFQLRKRGVESKLILGTIASTTQDQVLITNIAKAKDWLSRIQSGGSIADIATKERRSIRQIQRHLELAFLSPTIVALITQGTQPPELTSRQLINTPIPMNWDKQHHQFGINQASTLINRP